jgi:hypothetical protein
MTTDNKRFRYTDTPSFPLCQAALMMDFALNQLRNVRILTEDEDLLYEVACAEDELMSTRQLMDILTKMSAALVPLQDKTEPKNMKKVLAKREKKSKKRLNKTLHQFTKEWRARNGKGN